MATKEEILDAIGNMSVLELSELLKDFEEKFDVTAAAPVAAVAAAPAAGGDDGAAEEEKDSFDVVLTAAGDKKIQVIKEVRGLDGLLGLLGVVLAGAFDDGLGRRLDQLLGFLQTQVSEAAGGSVELQ